MAGIQASNGIVTGIDIQGTVDQLMSVAATPRTRLTNLTKQIQTEQVALTSLTALVVGVQLSTDRLSQPSLYSTTTATSSSASKIKASITAATNPTLSNSTLLSDLPGDIELTSGGNYPSVQSPQRSNFSIHFRSQRQHRDTWPTDQRNQ